MTRILIVAAMLAAVSLLVPMASAEPMVRRDRDGAWAYADPAATTPRCVGTGDPSSGCRQPLPVSSASATVFVDAGPVPDSEWDIVRASANVDAVVAGFRVAGQDVAMALVPPPPPMPGPGPCGAGCIPDWLAARLDDVASWGVATAVWARDTACEGACAVVVGPVIREVLCDVACSDPGPIRRDAGVFELLP